MRAKRSKRYRKTMQTYTLPPFNFREPYQVLLDAAFLRATHAFHMDVVRYLTNTLHGACRPYITRCTLVKLMKDHAKATGQKIERGQATDSIKGRPEFLPLPTEVPLRHCKHSPEETPVSEAECLLDLVAGQPRGNELPKNKQHFVLATADPSEKERRGKGYVDLREQVRRVPGVPVVYVRRSVMVLEELSGASERMKRGLEQEKLREGLVWGERKRKRGEDEGEEDVEDGDGVEVRKAVKRREKGPNPLSVRKKKVRVVPEAHGQAGDVKPNEAAPKAKRRRKHHSNKADDAASGAAAISAPAQETGV